ncbi:hypothetical protein AGLY_003558 [Aphis glycines]|uniref:Uncharacterized protein n=1 Tax=Aphis glycines TaxID=307491 RepID=A0A6G0TZX5_APHGL|nr:hypothetical protein AGLY_003558 [Aphis glycines]
MDTTQDPCPTILPILKKDLKTNIKNTIIYISDITQIIIQNQMNLYSIPHTTQVNIPDENQWDGGVSSPVNTSTCQCFKSLDCKLLEHVLYSLVEHCLYVKKSVIHNAAVLAQAPPKFVNVFNKVILVPPNNGSLIRAKNAITATNIEYIFYLYGIDFKYTFIGLGPAVYFVINTVFSTVRNDFFLILAKNSKITILVFGFSVNTSQSLMFIAKNKRKKPEKKINYHYTFLLLTFKCIICLVLYKVQLQIKLFHFQKCINNILKTLTRRLLLTSLKRIGVQEKILDIYTGEGGWLTHPPLQ